MSDDKSKAEKFVNWLNEFYLQTAINGTSEGFVHICQVDRQGAVVLP